MTKLLYVYLLLAFSCLSIDAADQGSLVKTAGAKRRADPDDEVCPTTPVGRKKQRDLSKWSNGRGLHASPGRGVPDEFLEALPNGLDTADKRAQALRVIEDAKRLASPEKKATLRVVQGMLGAELARPVIEDAASKKAPVSPGRLRSAVVSGAFAEEGLRKTAHLGIKKGQARPPKMFDVRAALFEEGYSVIPAVDVKHMSEAPVIESNGTLTGGHALDSYMHLPFKIVEQVHLPDHNNAVAIKVSYSTPKKGEVVKVKTVWSGKASTDGAVARRVLEADIIAVNPEGNRHLLQSPDGVCVGFLKGNASYGSVFPTRLIRADEFASPEILLGARDEGERVTITPDEVKESIKAQIRSNRKSITYFKDASGRYILSGIQIPGLPSGGSVEISPELQAELSLLLPAVPEMVSPVKVGTLIQFKPVATPSVGGAASFLRSSSPTRMGGGAASSSFGHELR